MSPPTTWPEGLAAKVAQALDELREVFGALTAVPDGQGGALVIIESVALIGLDQECSWSGFIIPSTYDEVQVYGHHFRPDLSREGQPLAGRGGVNASTWNEEPSVCVSRSSNRWRPGADTAALKLQKVIEFLIGA